MYILKNRPRLLLTIKGLFNLRIKLETTVVDLAMRGKLLSPAGGDGDGGSGGRNGGTRNVSLC